MAPDQSLEAHNPIAQSEIISASIQKSSETLVVDYMKSPGSGLDGSLHSALDANDPRIKFVMKSHSWKEVEPDETFDTKTLFDVALERESFEKAMEDFQKAQNPKYKIQILPSSLPPQDYIDEILRSISQAQQLYDDDAVKGFWGEIRKSFRKLGQNESAFIAWLGLLPVDSNYVSVLCGGLKLIIGAAARLRKLNEEVVGALCQIPQSLGKCRRLLSINKSSQQLRDCCTALYVAILHAMGHMLEYYRQNQLKKAMTAFGNQSRFETKLSAKIEAIKNCSKAIDDEALICSQELGKSTNQIVSTVEEVVKIENEKLDQLHATSRELITSNAELQQGQQNTDSKIDTLTGTMTNALTGIQKVFMDVTKLEELVRARVINELQKQHSMTLGASLEGNNEGSEHFTRSRTPSPLPKSSAVSIQATKKMLLSRLQKEYTTKAFSQIDIRSNLTHVFDLSLQDQDRAIHAMQALSQHSFLRISASSALLINGQASDISTRRTPLSFLCAKLCEALRTAPKTILCLSFFCGEHPSQLDEPLAGPAALLNSLIAQLVSQYRHFDFMLLDDRYVSSLDRDDIAALAKVLSKLVSQLPDYFMVFCVLDELTEYDDDSGGDDMVKLLGALLKLARRREKKGKGCMFKLLLTAAVELRLPLTMDLDADETIHVPEGLERQGGFTALQWDLFVGQDVREIGLLA